MRAPQIKWGQDRLCVEIWCWWPPPLSWRCGWGESLLTGLLYLLHLLSTSTSSPLSFCPASALTVSAPRCWGAARRPTWYRRSSHRFFILLFIHSSCSSSYSHIRLLATCHWINILFLSFLRSLKWWKETTEERKFLVSINIEWTRCAMAAIINNWWRKKSRKA